MSQNVGGKGFDWPEIKLILSGITFSINNLFLEDTATVATHTGFLKAISTRREICSNKDFLLKLVCH